MFLRGFTLELQLFPRIRAEKTGFQTHKINLSANIRGGFEVPDRTNSIQTFCSVAAVAALSNFWALVFGSPWPNTALPATRISAPARTTSETVSSRDSAIHFQAVVQSATRP